MTSAFWEVVEEAPELAPVILVGAREATAEEMPSGARLACQRIDEAGMTCRPTYASALVPNRKRKTGEVDENGARKYAAVAIVLESVYLRFGLPDVRGFVGWRRWSDRSWEAAGGAIRGRGQMRLFGVSELEAVLHDVVLGLPFGGDQPWARADARVKTSAPAPIRGPTGIWLVVAAPGAGVYPCRCDEPHWAPGKNCGPGKYPCPCWGRTDDLGSMPPTCCGLRASMRRDR